MSNFKSKNILKGVAAPTVNIMQVFPEQKIPESQKDLDWTKQNVNTIVGFGRQVYQNNRTSKAKKQINYNMMNGIFDEDDFRYVVNPFGIDKGDYISPERLHSFNIIAPKVNLLKGEELQRPFNFSAVSVNGQAFKAKEEHFNAKLNEYFTHSIMKELQEAGLLEMEENPETGEQIPKSPQQIQHWLETTYQDKREILANQVLQYITYQQKLKAKFNKGWEHALISGEEIYYIGIVSNEPVIRTVNPINFDYDKSPDLECIEDADWCREDRWLSKGAILDEFGEYLSDDEISQIDTGHISLTNPINSVYPGYAYENTLGNPGVNYSFNNRSSSNHIYVATCCWKSMKKIGFLSYIDEKGNPQETIVYEGFKLTPEMKEQGYELKWQWISEVRTAVRIGSDITIDFGPLPNQARSMDNPSICKLPYVGRIYNANNSISTSFVDMCKPYQYTYITIWYRLLLEVAKAKGKKMVLDIAQIPKSQGMDLKKWMHYFDNMGIAFINSFEEGVEGDPNSVSKFNQYTSIDLTLSNTIGQYINILDKLEDMMSQLIGVTRQREGTITSSETVGNTTRSVVQSSMITEHLFFTHDLVKQQVLTQLLEVAKIAFKKGKKTQFIIDDLYKKFLDIDGEMFADTNYGVFVSNSSKDNQIKDQLAALAQAAMQNDKLELSDLITIYKSNSTAEIASFLKQGEKQRAEREQQQMQQQQAHEKEMQKMAEDLETARRAWESQEKSLDRDNKIQLAQLTAMSYDETKDYDNNNIPDYLEINKIGLEKTKAQNEYQIKNQELALKAKQMELEHQRNIREQSQQDKVHKDTMDMKEKELEVKRIQAKNKPKNKN